MEVTPAPIIVSALFGAEDQAWFEALRRAHFPPERNQLAAHLTLFHHLPPSCADELRRRLTAETRGVRAPEARLAAPFSLVRGVASRIARRVPAADPARVGSQQFGACARGMRGW